MYNQKAIDPFTGAPVSKKTMQAALYMSGAFALIEAIKKIKNEIKNNNINIYGNIAF